MRMIIITTTVTVLAIMAVFAMTPAPAHAGVTCWEWSEGHVTCTDDEGNTQNCWEWSEGHVTCQ